MLWWNKDIYCVFGNDNRLDHYIVDQKKADGENCIISLDAGRPDQWYCLNIYRDYIFELVLPEKISMMFEKIFKETEWITDEVKKSFKKAFDTRCTHTLMITRNQKRANNIIKTIKNLY